MSELHIAAATCGCGAIYHGLGGKCPICTGAQKVTLKIDDSAQSTTPTVTTPPPLLISWYQQWSHAMWNWQDLNETPLPWDMRDDFLMVTGLAGEVGEVMEILKKVERKRKRKPDAQLDKEHLIEEIGDVLYYLTILATRHDIKMDEVIAKNIAKLELRKAGKI